MDGVFIPHVATKLLASTAKARVRVQGTWVHRRCGCTGNMGAQETQISSLVTAVASLTAPALR